MMYWLLVGVVCNVSELRSGGASVGWISSKETMHLKLSQTLSLHPSLSESSLSLLSISISDKHSGMKSAIVFLLSVGIAGGEKGVGLG